MKNRLPIIFPLIVATGCASAPLTSADLATAEGVRVQRCINLRNEHRIQVHTAVGHVVAVLESDGCDAAQAAFKEAQEIDVDAPESCVIEELPDMATLNAQLMAVCTPGKDGQKPGDVAVTKRRAGRKCENALQTAAAHEGAAVYKLETEGDCDGALDALADMKDELDDLEKTCELADLMNSYIKVRKYRAELRRSIAKICR